MATDILMPQLGLTMNEGTITEWAKKEGDKVAKGDLLFYVENDKAVIPYESQGEGILANIIVGPMATATVGAVVARLIQPGERAPENPPAPPAAGAAPSAPENVPAVTSVMEDRSASTLAATSMAAEKPASAPASAPSQEEQAGFVTSSPFARKLADQQGIALQSIRGTGPDGAVIARDVRIGAPSSATSAANTAVPPFSDQRLSRIRQVAAARLTESWGEIPQFTLSIEARAQGLIDAQSAFAALDDKISITALLARLTGAALRDFPLLNASWLGDGQVRVYSAANISIAVDSPDGLVVPTLRDCGERGVRELNADLRELAEKARARTLSPEAMQGGTITISNLGMFGITRFRAIVNPPQCAILSVGAIVRRPEEFEGGFRFIPTIEIGLTADHRIVDGAYGARFLAQLKRYIEHPVLALG